MPSEVGAPPLRHLLWLQAGLALALAPHVLRLPWWVSATAAISFLWCTYGAWRRRPAPNPRLLLAIALAEMIGVYLTYRTIFGRDAGVTLLALLAGLKLLEIRSQRDLFILAFLAYFLALTNFFYSQTIPTAALMLATVLVITTGLVGFNAVDRADAGNLKTAAWMLVQAGPVMLLLFVLFPRVPGPLWGLPQDAYAGMTGLSDTMSPGDIIRLSLSDSIAFRVKFDGEPPPRALLYWRGPVLSRFDGRRWMLGPSQIRREIELAVGGAPVDYEVTLEPHNRNWIFALEMPASVPPSARITDEYELISLAPVRNRIRYAMRSYPSYRAADGADPRELRADLALPAGVNPRARALAAEWRERASSDAGILDQAIAFLRRGRFVYTLEPPPLGVNSVDDFLFDSRQGFCEHFASSFAFLMRAAGIPARVVTGYQGGERNPVDGYWVVRQTDAHAWVEVWLAGRGWVRVDPTAAAAPARIESGLTAAVPQSAVAALPLLVRTHLDWLRELRDNWEALANTWNQWVLGYTPERQREVLGRLGVAQPDWQTLTMILFWSVGAVVLAVALGLLRSVRREDAAQRAWRRFCAKLERAGIARAAHEGPLDFSARAGRALPSHRDELDAIAQLYAELRYGRAAGRDALVQLQQRVRRFAL